MAARTGAPAKGERGVVGGFATLNDGSTAWVLVDEAGAKALGPSLLWAARQHLHELHLVVDDPLSAGVLARRANGFTFPVRVWLIDGHQLVAAEPAPIRDVELPEAAQRYVAVFEAMGAEAVVEHGVLTAEVAGLEVARVIVDDRGAARVETGVGRFDREASALLHGGLPELDAIQRVIDIVRRHRRPGAEPHPLNRLAPERWLRRWILDDPARIGCRDLRALAGPVVRDNLKDPAPAFACGHDPDGTDVLVACSVGVDLDLVPSAVDGLVARAPAARLVLVVPERDAHPGQRTLASLVAPEAADIRAVPDTWRA